MYNIMRCLLSGKPETYLSKDYNGFRKSISFLWNGVHVRLLSGSQKLHWKTKKLSVKLYGEVLFGIHPVQLALQARKRCFNKLYIKETSEPTGTESYINAALLAEGLVEKTWVSKFVLDKLADGRPHQGICLDAGPLNVPDLDLSEDLDMSLTSNQRRFPVWLLPYRVKDPQNLGAILRSSYFLGVEQVVIPTVHTCPLNSMTSKASSGAMEIMNLSQIKNDKAILQFIQKWKDSGGKVIGASLDKDMEPIPIEKYSVEGPILLVVGNEEKGIKHSISSVCDNHVSISSVDNIHPMMDSLNVSVATGILLYHLTQSKS